MQVTRMTRRTRRKRMMMIRASVWVARPESAKGVAECQWVQSTPFVDSGRATPPQSGSVTR